MTKSLIVILHHNTIKYTDQLYEMLKPYENSGNYELIVIDNGSDEGKSSKYSTYKSDENVYFGGGLDMAMKLFIDNPQYDSFGFYSSDIILHGNNFIKTLRDLLFKQDDLMVISPCVIQPEKSQCFWKQMHCWNSTNLRIVPFVDYMCPLMKRKFVETAKSFDSKYGWVQDLMTGFICEDNNWKIGVCDWTPVIHISNGTVKDNPHLSNYNILAQQEMNEYFIKRGTVDRAEKLKIKGATYEYSNTL
jgi:hypothetical protein